MLFVSVAPTHDAPNTFEPVVHEVTAEAKTGAEVCKESSALLRS